MWCFEAPAPFRVALIMAAGLLGGQGFLCGWGFALLGALRPHQVRSSTQTPTRRDCAGVKRSGVCGRGLHVHGRSLESLRGLPHVIGALLCQP